MFRPSGVYLCPSKLIRYKAGLHRGEIREKAGAILYGAQRRLSPGEIPEAMVCMLKQMAQRLLLCCAGTSHPKKK